MKPPSREGASQQFDGSIPPACPVEAHVCAFDLYFSEQKRNRQRKKARRGVEAARVFWSGGGAGVLECGGKERQRRATAFACIETLEY